MNYFKTIKSVKVEKKKEEKKDNFDRSFSEASTAVSLQIKEEL